ncbi:unnamed protein product [Clonostachys rhizophaga]|uniref:Uncharacterized protein n=1 Tax=Clonostachys rhizophaga TaxID=160324 RepID=A0A9N9VED5_9HYPO|nr:unnamed protein product [Clonostachys rhizophaga]
MAPMLLTRTAQVLVPVAGQVMSVLITMVALTAITSFITQRTLAIKVWGRLPYIVWLVFAINIDSYLFVFTTALLQHAFGVNYSKQLCEGAILLCLACYVTTKLIYLFLVEKAHIIRGTTKKRLKSKLYLFNSFGIMSVFIIVIILNFIYRIVRMEQGQCFIGMEGVGIIPLITFDSLANTYLTLLFLVPLRKIYKFRKLARTQANHHLQNVALRTFIGALCTLISSVTNLTVLMALNGEPGWVCLMCCNCDATWISRDGLPIPPFPNWKQVSGRANQSSLVVLFSAAVIHWVTSKDNAGTSGSLSSHGGAGNGGCPENGGTPPRRHNGQSGSDTEPPPSSTTMDEIALVTAARPSSRRHSDLDDDFDDESCSQADAVLSKAANPKGTVVVTTTIKRESRPNGAGNKPLSGGSISIGDNCYQHSPRTTMVRGGDGFSNPQTRISGGSPQSQR